MNKIENHIIKILEKNGVKEISLEIPPSIKMGDYAFACFLLAKNFKKAPNAIATGLANKIKSDIIIDKVEANGPYINFFVKRNYFLKNLEIKNPEKNGEKIVVEFSSPNTNKPLHLGHVRNNLLGDSVSRIIATKNKVFKTCVVNDRGVHICKSILAYMKWGEGANPNKKGDHYVGDWYVKFAKEVEKDPLLEEEAQSMLVDWEKGKKEIIDLWKKMNKWVYEGFGETYKNLGISFDKIYYESEYYDKGSDIAKEQLKKSVFSLDDKNNIVAPLTDKGFDNDKVILRADGTSVYMTQDIYLAKMKHDDFKYNKSIYVVGNEQILHFQQLFKIIDMIGLVKAENLYHLSYGMVNLPDGKMKSREGKVVDADDLIEEMIDLAKIEVEKRYDDLTEKEKNKRARIIGLAALKFFILKHDPSKDMTYNPKMSISFEGETGPYVQYAYARIRSIFRKAKISKVNPSSFDDVSDKEYELARKIDSFISMIDDAAKHYKPSLIARYLIELVQLFGSFYNDHKIIGEEKKVFEKRMFLIQNVAEVIKQGLDLLGIEVLEQM